MDSSFYLAEKLSLIASGTLLPAKMRRFFPPKRDVTQAFKTRVNNI